MVKKDKFIEYALPVALGVVIGYAIASFIQPAFGAGGGIDLQALTTLTSEHRNPFMDFALN